MYVWCCCHITWGWCTIIISCSSRGVPIMKLTTKSTDVPKFYLSVGYITIHCNGTEYVSLFFSYQKSQTRWVMFLFISLFGCRDYTLFQLFHWNNIFFRNMSNVSTGKYRWVPLKPDFLGA